MNSIVVDYVSQAMKRKVSFNVILPNGPAKNILLLLHGRGDNKETWMQYTNLIRYNQSTVIIMPSGDLSFYLNRKHGEQFQDYLIELLNYGKNNFKLETDEVHVAGNSMGGFGSLVLAQKYPNLFTSIGIFSPALILDEEYRKVLPNQLVSEDIANAIKDEKVLHEISKKVYLYCGREDKFYQDCVEFSKEYDIELNEDDFGHEWDAWDLCVKNYIMERL